MARMQRGYGTQPAQQTTRAGATRAPARRRGRSKRGSTRSRRAPPRAQFGDVELPPGSARPRESGDPGLRPEALDSRLRGNERRARGSSRTECALGACSHKVAIGDSDLINVCFGPICGLKSDISPGPRCVRLNAPQQKHCYSITSSALAERPGGTSRPSAFAAFRLITNSNSVDWTTGRFAGFSPLSTRPVYRPAWR